MFSWRDEFNRFNLIVCLCAVVIEIAAYIYADTSIDSEINTATITYFLPAYAIVVVIILFWNPYWSAKRKM